MEVSGKNTSVNLEAYIKNLKQAGKADAAAENVAKQIRREDTVVLSDAAKEIHELRKALDTVPDVRDEKVARLKQQIDSGTYRVDGNNIAFRMIRESIMNELS